MIFEQVHPSRILKRELEARGLSAMLRASVGPRIESEVEAAA